MKIALVHDYLKEYGGAERVLEVLHEIFPKAPLYTAYCDLVGLGEHGSRFKSWDIRTSWLQKIPFAEQLVSPFRVFAPLTFESFDLSEYDLVISSCNAYFSKAIITKPEALHISYIHTPPRYLYGYTTSFNYKKNPITRVLGEIANHFLRIFDFETSQRPDILVANSKNVQARIKKFYRRDSVVIYPPVDITVILNEVKNLSLASLSRRSGRMRGVSNKPPEASLVFDGLRDPSLITQDDKRRKEYFLVLSRLVRGKGVETVVEACGRLGLSFKVAGTGPELDNLKCKVQSAKWNTIEFLGQVEDKELPKLYAQAKALVVASEDEDFGITAVEAQAAGTPVIAPASGGFLETVEDGKTGVLYGGHGQVDVDSLIAGINRFNDLNDDIKAEDCRENAERFSKGRFKKEILELVEKNLRG